jgi:hypothetical protein
MRTNNSNFGIARLLEYVDGIEWNSRVCVSFIVAEQEQRHVDCAFCFGQNMSPFMAKFRQSGRKYLIFF